VVVVHNLPAQFNCDRLFNLVCLYGNVSKIFFMKTKTGCAMVEMGDWEGAHKAVSNLGSVELFGSKLQLDISRKHCKITNAPLEFELSDGTSSVKDYFMGQSRMNRFTTPEMSKKNRILPPTKVVHFYGIPKVVEEEVEKIFTGHGAATPNKIKWVETKKEQTPREGREEGGVGEGQGTT